MGTLNRREFMGLATAGLGAAGVLPTWLASAQTRSAKPLNVLHVMSDDLCACLGCYGHPLVKSPNIDRLAARGVLFNNAYCQLPLCNPSRASYMTGLRPDTIAVHDNQTEFRQTTPGTVTLPQSFRKAGYYVARVGKIYHYGVPRQIGTDGLDDPASWEHKVNPRGRDMDDISITEVLELGEDGAARTVTGKSYNATGGTLSWLAADGTDAEQTDGVGAAESIKILEHCASQNKPFYLATGFYRPHTPFVAPKSYFDLYPLDAIPLPQVPADLEARFPAAALATRRPAQTAMSDDLRRRAIQAYYASTTFMDAQVGLLLSALDRLGLADNTVVVFHSDHGYHLGEKDLWQKQSLFEESARVPLVIATPDARAAGEKCTRTVELVSLHKTLTDLCDIPADTKTQGHSMARLVRNPDARWNHPAYTQTFRRAPGQSPQSGSLMGFMGRSLRTERWRYTEWDEGRAGTELYDHASDPEEMTNLAAVPAHKEEIAKLSKLLRAGGE